MAYPAGRTGAAAEQTGIGNAVAAVPANDTALRAVREVRLLRLERPGTRGHFSAGRPLPEDPEERDGAVTIAELPADVLGHGVPLRRNVPGSDSAAPWTACRRHLLAAGPVLRDLVRERPERWPELVTLLPADPSS